MFLTLLILYSCSENDSDDTFINFKFDHKWNETNINSEYLYYLLHNCDIKKVFYSLGGGLRQTLRFDELKRFPLILPPIKEQIEIVNKIKKEIKKIDSDIKNEQNRIQLLNEFKYSLISEVVTGSKRLT